MTKTVRLPIYNGVGIETRSYLELEVSHLIRALDVVPSRVVHGEGVEVELFDVPSMHPTLTREELQMLSAASPEEIDTSPTVEEWRTIESLPVRSFEINREGVVRHRATGRRMNTYFDIDQLKERTVLTINGQEFSIDGPRLAKAMWGEKDD